MVVEKLVNLGARKVFVKIIGDGAPIVFLHGGPGSEHSFFLPHVIPLSQNFKLVLYDQTGCGKSEPDANGLYSMNQEVMTLEMLRTELNLDKINLFGESWGSMLALLYATRYPEQVNKIFLTAAIGITSEGFRRFKEKLLSRLSLVDKFRLFKVDRARRRGRASFEDVLNILDPYYVFSKDALTAKASYRMNAVANQLISEDIENNYDLSGSTDKLSRIPIVVVQGRDDILSPKEIGKLLLNYIPHAKLYAIENSGHWVVVEKPNEINAIAQEFLAPKC